MIKKFKKDEDEKMKVDVYECHMLELVVVILDLLYHDHGGRVLPYAGAYVDVLYIE